MPPPIYAFDEFRLNPATRELRRDGERVVLPLRVLVCLQYLIEHRERAVGRDELIRAVWHRDNVSDIRLGQLVLRARRAIGDEAARQERIRTVVGFGYHWVAPTRVLTDAEAVPASARGRDPAAAPDEAVSVAAGGAASPSTHRRPTRSTARAAPRGTIARGDAAAPAASSAPTMDVAPASADAPARESAAAARPDGDAERDRATAAAAPPPAPDAATNAVRGRDSARLPRRPARTIAALAVAALAAIAVVGIASLRRTPPASGATAAAVAALDAGGAAAPRRIAVLPLDVPASADLAWARLGGMDLVADRLRRAGVAVVPSETTLALLGHATDADASPDLAELRRLGAAALVVAGGLARDDAGWRARLRVGDDPRLRADAAGAEPMDALRRAADALLARMGRAPER
ncbi:MAG TPA: winged helix-turn-helix domain-containing protein, partial [Dokdonella sp.]